MGVYVTQTRINPACRAPKFWMSHTRVAGGAKAFLFPEGMPDYYLSFEAPRQTTFSYRSGEGFDGSSDLESHLSQTKGTSLSRVRALDSVSNTEYDTGHPFSTQKYGWDFSLTNWVGRDRRYDWWGGVLSPSFTSSGYGLPLDEFADSISTPLSAYGPQAIRDTVPNRSSADLAQALIELKREGLPALIGSTFLRRRPGSIPVRGSEEYLNLEFGIKPLLRDLQDASRAVLNAREIINDFVEESGDKLHRTRSFPVQSGSTLFSNWDGVAYLQNHPRNPRDFFSLPYFPLHDSMSWTQKVYFKGAYSYYLDPDWFEGIVGFANQAEYLLGLEMTPELLWEVTPWSWLVDWVTNIGDQISNLTSLGSDNLVLRYGYLMRHTRVQRTRALRGVKPKYHPMISQKVSATLSFERKERIRASPYGFGLDPDTFTGRQWSILGALGMTRGNRSLRLSD